MRCKVAVAVCRRWRAIKDEVLHGLLVVLRKIYPSLATRVPLVRGIALPVSNSPLYVVRTSVYEMPVSDTQGVRFHYNVTGEAGV